MKRLFFHILTTSICLLLVLMHDIRPIVAAASLSIFALIISFIILLVFGFIRYGITFDSSFWVPSSTIAFLSSIGIPSYSLGYNFSYLSFYVEFFMNIIINRKSYQIQVKRKLVRLLLRLLVLPRL